MSEFITTFICPNAIRGTLTYPTPVPLNILSADGISMAQNGAFIGEHTGAGGPLGFKTGDIGRVLHRNWKPHAWDIVGYAHGRFEASGLLAESPGPITGPLGEGLVEASIRGDFEGTELAPTKIQPDFSFESNPRQMIAWDGLGDGDYPYIVQAVAEGPYVPFWDENGLNPTAWYIQSTFRAFARLEPYIWEFEGNYYCEQEIRMSVATECVPFPGATPTDNWSIMEGSSFHDLGGSSTSRDLSEGREGIGNVTIQDITGVDTVPNWGNLTMWNASTSQSTPINITLRIKSNFLPHPGY